MRVIKLKTKRDSKQLHARMQSSVFSNKKKLFMVRFCYYKCYAEFKVILQ